MGHERLGGQPDGLGKRRTVDGSCCAVGRVNVKFFQGLSDALQARKGRLFRPERHGPAFIGQGKTAPAQPIKKATAESDQVVSGRKNQGCRGLVFAPAVEPGYRHRLVLHGSIYPAMHLLLSTDLVLVQRCTPQTPIIPECIGSGKYLSHAPSKPALGKAGVNSNHIAQQKMKCQPCAAGTGFLKRHDNALRLCLCGILHNVPPCASDLQVTTTAIRWAAGA